MICQGNFNWQGRVRVKVKDIIRVRVQDSVKVTCSLGQNSANIPQFQFCKLGLLSAICMSDGGDLMLSIFLLVTVRSSI